jgi:hypothetical protein
MSTVSANLFVVVDISSTSIEYDGNARALKTMFEPKGDRRFSNYWINWIVNILKLGVVGSYRVNPTRALRR